MEYAKEIISAAALIVVAIIEAMAAKDRRKADADRKEILERSKIRAQESKLAMSLMCSTCELGLETTKALRDGYTNGTLNGRMEEAEQSLKAYKDFIQEEAAGAVSK